jgi:hypothetical protein
MPTTPQDSFAAIRAERVTASGRAAVDRAEALYLNDPKESRLWLGRALDFDKAHGDAELQRIANARRAKGKTREKAQRMADKARAAGDNVVPMTGRGDAI